MQVQARNHLWLSRTQRFRQDTNIRMLCGLLTPDAGRGTCLGFDIRTDCGIDQASCRLHDSTFSLYEDLSVRGNLDFVARIYGLPGPAQSARSALARFGLDERREQMAGSLSGGWKQRLSLAAGTLPDPQLLLLDEPTAGVDPTARREFWSEIHALASDGLTVLVSTHYMDEAERCHEIAYIADGHVLAQGTIDAVVARAALVTFVVTADGLAQLATELAAAPGVDMVAPFDAILHVSGRDAAALQAAIAPYRGNPALEWAQSPPSIEDVFIELETNAPGRLQ
jgi:ABC-2 type transport system ATP-binding protein